MKRKVYFYGKEIGEKNFCGRNVFQFELDIYEPPFKTEPTTNGWHDFNTCEVCKEMNKYYPRYFLKKHKEQNFPYCCERHKKLLDIPDFDKSHFDSAPEMLCEKLMFTKQHIINNIENDNFYKEITDYVAYTIQSFGKMPEGCGVPLYLNTYFDNMGRLILHLLKQDEIPKNRMAAIAKFFLAYLSPSGNNFRTNLEILKNTYNEWFNILPLDVSYFSHLKEQLQNKWLSVISCEPEFNPYLGMRSAKLQTKEKLIENLTNLTNEFLTSVSSYLLHKKGKLSKPNKLKAELILAKRRTKLKTGYIKTNVENKEFARMVNEWIEDEKTFIEEITPLLHPKKDDDKDETPFNLTNNFDIISTGKIYKHFKEGLVDSKMLTVEELEKYLKAAFEDMKPPTELFTFKNKSTHNQVYKTFHTYFKDVAAKPYGKKDNYVELLSEYFQGYNKETVKTNWTKYY